MDESGLNYLLLLVTVLSNILKYMYAVICAVCLCYVRMESTVKRYGILFQSY